MTQPNEFKTQRIHPAPLAKRILFGAGIALILISAFLISAGEGNPEWPKLWMVRPLIIVPIAGAAGGAFFYIMDHLRYQGGWKKIAAVILSVVGYLFVLWIGTVLGLDGTWWD